MSDYFDQVGREMRHAVRRRAHLPWYERLLRTGRPRALAVVLAALVVATPAVAAATNWFGIGAPDRIAAGPPTQFAGRAIPGTSELLGLRVADPQGGPPWGLRLVHTTRDDTCIQLGRVEAGKLGSLGIDEAWDNDHLFHAFPNSYEGDDCGTTDAVGNGFVNVAYTGVVANANPSSGARLKSCTPLARRSSEPVCPRGAVRIVFMGLLGPDATSVTYEAPDGRLQTAATSGRDGAYLLVFPFNPSTCKLYTQGPQGGYGPCGGTESVGGASPDDIGAIKAVTYRDGHRCSLVASQAKLAALRAFVRTLARPPAHSTPAARQAFYEHALTPFLAAEHLTRAGLRNLQNPQCPAVGYVAAKERKLTAGQVRSPIRVTQLSRAYHEFRIDISFLARQPVTSSSSFYEFYLSDPSGCSSGGESGGIGFGNVRAGTEIHDDLLIGPCRGTYHGVIGYTQNTGPVNEAAGAGGMPGQDGSLIVGHFTVTTH